MKKIGKKLPTGLRLAKLASELASPDLDFKVGACLLYKGLVLISWNRILTSPEAMRWYQYACDGQFHAEYGLYSKAIVELLPIKGTVYTWRSLANGSSGMARPCASCRKMLKSYGIRRIIFSIDGNMYEEEKL